MNKNVKVVTVHLTARHHRPKEKFTLSAAAREKCQGIIALAQYESNRQKMGVKGTEHTRQKLPWSPERLFLGRAILFLKNSAIWNKLFAQDSTVILGKYIKIPGLT